MKHYKVVLKSQGEVHAASYETDYSQACLTIWNLAEEVGLYINDGFFYQIKIGHYNRVAIGSSGYELSMEAE